MFHPWFSENEEFDANLGHIVELNPSLVDFMMLATSKLRWDEQSTMPHTQVSHISVFLGIIELLGEIATNK